jgi:hypothetical protein
MDKNGPNSMEGQKALEIIKRLKGKAQEGSDDANEWLRVIRNEVIDCNPVSAIADEYLAAMELNIQRVRADEFTAGGEYRDDLKNCMDALIVALARERDDTKRYIRAARSLARGDAELLKSGSEPEGFTRERIIEAAGYQIDSRTSLRRSIKTHANTYGHDLFTFIKQIYQAELDNNSDNRADGRRRKTRPITDNRKV